MKTPNIRDFDKFMRILPSNIRIYECSERFVLTQLGKTIVFVEIGERKSRRSIDSGVSREIWTDGIAHEAIKYFTWRYRSVFAYAEMQFGFFSDPENWKWAKEGAAADAKITFAVDKARSTGRLQKGTKKGETNPPPTRNSAISKTVMNAYYSYLKL